MGRGGRGAPLWSTRSRRSTRRGAWSDRGARQALARADAAGLPARSLERAHAQARVEHVSTTDDAALFERLGLPVVVVRGSERAMKITDEEDFPRAEALYATPE